MLLLLGGPPRCGKTLLAQRLAAGAGMGWLSTDTLRSVVNVAIPLYEPGGIGAPHGPEADRLFPYLERAVQSCAYLVEDYLIEGVGFYPRHAVALAEHTELRCVFVGTSHITVEAILRHEDRNRWHRHIDPDELARVPAWIEAWSEELRLECAALGVPYVDLADGFDEGQARAAELLLGDSAPLRVPHSRP
jgi:hypothetical protein